MSSSKILNKNELPQKKDKLTPYCKDITNIRFDKLIALYPSIYKKEDGSILWVCKCDCGNYILRSGSDLKRKGSHNCGYHFKENQNDYSKKLRTELNGKIFNNLQVLDFDHIDDKRIFLKCKCLKCGNVTIVRKDSLLNGHKSSCGCVHSKGESLIESILQNKNIYFKREFIFDNLYDKGCLRFDFALFDAFDNLIGLIEYQGVQHTLTTTGWNNPEHLAKTQYHDTMKKEYCNKNNIKLYYITYKDNIEERLKEILDELYSE